MDINWH